MRASNDERWGSVYDDLMRGRVVGPVEVEDADDGLYCDFRGLFVAPKWDGWRYVCGGCGKELHGL